MQTPTRLVENREPPLPPAPSSLPIPKNCMCSEDVRRDTISRYPGAEFQADWNTSPPVRAAGQLGSEGQGSSNLGPMIMAGLAVGLLVFLASRMQKA